MTASFKRRLMIVPNKLYGDKEVAAYVCAGVAVARVGKAWGVYHYAKGSEVYHKLRRPTLAAAKRVAVKIAALPIDWTLKPGVDEFDKAFRAVADDIRGIAS